jgi:hypothetical protein
MHILRYVTYKFIPVPKLLDCNAGLYFILIEWKKGTSLFLHIQAVLGWKELERQ